MTHGGDYAPLVVGEAEREEVVRPPDNVVRPRRFGRTPLVGPVIATMMVAVVGASEIVGRGRDFGAFCGVVPRHRRPRRPNDPRVAVGARQQRGSGSPVRTSPEDSLLASGRFMLGDTNLYRRSAMADRPDDRAPR
jgi:hypothetical protein